MDVDNLLRLQRNARQKVRAFLTRYPDDYADLLLVEAPVDMFAVTIRVGGRPVRFGLFNAAAQMARALAGPDGRGFGAQIPALERAIHLRLQSRWAAPAVLAAVAESILGPEPAPKAPKAQKHVTFAEPEQPKAADKPKAAPKPKAPKVPEKPKAPPKVPAKPEKARQVLVDLDAPLDFDELDRQMAAHA